jgi:Tfp pilus assembly protein PilN
MPSINMIAPRRTEKKRLETNVRRLLLAILVEVVIILGVSGLMITRIYATNVRISDLEFQRTKLQPTVRRIEYYDKATKELKPKLDTLTNAKADTLRWCRVMDSVSMSLPNKTWLTRITANPVTDPNATELVLSINGVSVSQELIGETMLRMHDNVTDFDRVDLNFTQKTLIGATPAFEFEFAAGIKIAKTNGEVVKS